MKVRNEFLSPIHSNSFQKDQKIKLHFVETTKQLADMMTKNLNFDLFEKNWNGLGLEIHFSLSQGDNAHFVSGQSFKARMLDWYFK